MRGKGVVVVAWQAKSRGSVADETAYLLHYPLRDFPPLMLCTGHAGITLSNAPAMSSDSSIATSSLFCHVAWIC